MNTGTLGAFVAIHSTRRYRSGGVCPPEPKPPAPEKNYGVVFSVLGIWVAVGLFVLVAWLNMPPAKPPVVEESTNYEYVIVHVDPPKNCYIEVMNGGERHNLYVSKHYQEWQDLEGKTIKLRREKLRYEDGRTEWRFTGVRQACDEVVTRGDVE